MDGRWSDKTDGTDGIISVLVININNTAMSTALTFLLEIVIDSRLFLRRIDNISATYNQSINQLKVEINRHRLFPSAMID